MAEELVDIVNESNEVVRTALRSTMRRERLPHRASYIACRNPEGRFLIEVRTLSKDYAPGLLDACIGGVVQAGEDPLLSARRELSEEVGLEAGRLAFHSLGTLRIDYPRHNPHSFLFAYLFLALGDGITVRQPEEVSGIMYLQAEELLQLQDNFTDDSITAFLEILKRSREQGLIS